PPGAPEAGRHLVDDEQHAVAVAGLADPAEVAVRRGEHAGGGLDQRLDDDRGGPPPGGGGEPPHLRGARLPGPPAGWAAGAAGAGGGRGGGGRGSATAPARSRT